jgi:hypothetical protein
MATPLPRASEAWRVSNCPRSHTALHTFFEFGLLKDELENKYAADSVTQHKALAGEEVELTPDQQKTVQESRQLEDEFVADFFPPDTPITDHSEYSLESQYWTGHIDRAVLGHLGNNVALIFDRKQIVWGDHYSASNNPQIWVYVHLLSVNHPHLDKCLAGIVQPGHTLETALFDDFKELHNWARVTSEQAMNPMSKLKAGQWCEHCRLKAICPAGRKYLADTQELALDEEAPLADPKVLGMLLDRFRILSWFEDAVRNMARALLKSDPNSVTGWRLTRGRTVTVIRDLPLAMKIADGLLIERKAWMKESPPKLALLLRKAVQENQLSQSLFDQIIGTEEEAGSLRSVSKDERTLLGL